VYNLLIFVCVMCGKISFFYNNSVLIYMCMLYVLCLCVCTDVCVYVRMNVYMCVVCVYSGVSLPYVSKMRQFASFLLRSKK